MNFLITNDRIVYPLLDAATDGEAQRILEDLPGAPWVVGVPCPGDPALLRSSGRMTSCCITRSDPSGKWKNLFRQPRLVFQNPTQWGFIP